MGALEKAVSSWLPRRGEGSGSRADGGADVDWGARIQVEKTILLVDDEPNVLSSLRRVLRREGWNLLTAGSGREGLDLLDRQPVDVVVSDIRMPEMDGVAFLEQVKERHPGAARIILTGFVERGNIATVVERAGIQQIIAKPWDDEELRVILREVLAQRDRQEAEGAGLKRIINEIDVLPSLPDVYLEVRRLMEEEESPSADRLAQVVSRDPGMATKILQVANTAIFGQRRKIDTVGRAIVVLGLKFMGKLVLSASVFRSLSSPRKFVAGFDQEALWEHSVRCGAVARQISRQSARGPEGAEQAMLAGTLHDLGKLIFATYLPDRYEGVIRAARDRRSPLVEVEEEMLETTHAAAGAHLADWWNFPAELVDAIRWHHDPAASSGEMSSAAVVHLADVLVNRVSTHGSGNGRPPDVVGSTCEALGLDPTELDRIEAQMKADVGEEKAV